MIYPSHITPDLSIIIPVWKEQDIIQRLICHIRNIAGYDAYEIIVVDGDPDHETADGVCDQGVITIQSERGRAIQMNAGAEIASGRILLFLHADTYLPENGFQCIFQTCYKNRYAGGAFDLEIDHPGWQFRIIETAASLRSRLTRIPYGDQAIFLKKEIFFKLGKYHEIPLMEDVKLMQRVSKEGYRIRLIREPVKTSARKWLQDGILVRTIRNWKILALYLLNVDPQELVRLYYHDFFTL